MAAVRISGRLAVIVVFTVGVLAVVGFLLIHIALFLAFLPGHPVPVQPLNGSLPAQFPESFPVYPGAVPVSLDVISPGKTHESDRFELAASDPPAAVLAWYRAKLPSAGWRIDRPQCCGVPNVAFSDPDRFVYGDIIVGLRNPNVLRGPVIENTVINVSFTHYTQADADAAQEQPRSVIPETFITIIGGIATGTGIRRLCRAIARRRSVLAE